MSTELLAQLNALIANAEANQVEAALWRETRSLMIEAGYGPRITPRQIVDLVPNVHLMNEFVATTQEVVPVPSGSKFPRRKLTVEDEHEITKRSDYGEHPEKIAAALGISLKAVVAFLERD